MLQLEDCSAKGCDMRFARILDSASSRYVTLLDRPPARIALVRSWRKKAGGVKHSMKLANSTMAHFRVSKEQARGQVQMRCCREASRVK